MFSKSLAVGVLAAGCIAAAAGGAYLAVRHNAAAPQPTVAAPATAPADAARPVSETEAVVTSDAAQQPAGQPSVAAEAPAATAERPAPAKPADAVKVERETPRVAEPRSRRQTASPANGASRQSAREHAAQTAPAPTHERRDAPDVVAPVPPPPAPAVSRSEVPEVAPRPETPPPPQFESLTVPASSVVGLRVETPLSTERARLEDRVNGRVTRDVMADGRVAIPAGAQAIGSVTLVERGGKIKEKARLGVRFHTLVLADGTELPINTEAIYREGEPPAGESTRKIGGAAVGGAILGALIGGKKGAIVGATTGAAGGTAVVMAGDRNAATLPTGTIVTVRLAAPVSVDVEKR